jgi:hypothetical protein
MPAPQGEGRGSGQARAYLIFNALARVPERVDGDHRALGAERRHHRRRPCPRACVRPRCRFAGRAGVSVVGVPTLAPDDHRAPRALIRGTLNGLGRRPLRPCSASAATRPLRARSEREGGCRRAPIGVRSTQTAHDGRDGHGTSIAACSTRSDTGTSAAAMATPPATPRRSRTPDTRAPLHSRPRPGRGTVRSHGRDRPGA